MASSSNSNSSTRGVRVIRRNCECEKKAALKISETDNNKNRVFYTCAGYSDGSRRKCKYFRWAYQLEGTEFGAEIEPMEGDEIRVIRRNCECEKKAALKISETDNNKYRVFYTCAGYSGGSRRKCKYFRWAYQLEGTDGEALSENTRLQSLENEIEQMKVVLENEIEQMKEVLQDVRGGFESVGCFLKVVVVVGLLLSFLKK
ncbi:uncharacterized protein LOC143846452 [Tasmannia lanceolata]|uniref:uncharacterized protein LOC143846452 n=1 Tax=Tasmannia lanceolata TaxID=3420 RepID=UPI004063F845